MIRSGVRISQPAPSSLYLFLKISCQEKVSQAKVGAWYSGRALVSKTNEVSSILTAPAINIRAWYRQLCPGFQTQREACKSFNSYQMRNLHNGSASAFQADSGGPIPLFRSILAGVGQWQSTCLPCMIYGFDSRRSLHIMFHSQSAQPTRKKSLKPRLEKLCY